MSKGSQRRKCLIPPKLEQLRWKLALGKITFDEYEIRLKELKKVK